MHAFYLDYPRPYPLSGNTLSPKNFRSRKPKSICQSSWSWSWNEGKINLRLRKPTFLATEIKLTRSSIQSKHRIRTQFLVAFAFSYCFILFFVMCFASDLKIFLSKFSGRGSPPPSLWSIYLWLYKCKTMALPKLN